MGEGFELGLGAGGEVGEGGSTGGRKAGKQPSALLQEPPHPAVDIISQLPTEVLSTILTYLPTKDAARTTILSSRYRHLFKTSPLHLTDTSIVKEPRIRPYRRKITYLNEGQQDVLPIIEHILSSHAGPIHSINFSRFLFGFAAHFFKPLKQSILQTWEELEFDESYWQNLLWEELEFDKDFWKGNRWCELLAERGIRELRFLHDYCGDRELSLREVKLFTLPECLVSCDSLNVLELGNCQFPESDGGSKLISYSNLRSLKLVRMQISEGLLRRVLSGCPVLERLDITSCTGCRRMSVCSKSLRVWTVRSICLGETGEIVVEDAPSLEELILGEYIMHQVGLVRVVHAPKLEVVGWVNIANAKKLVFGENHLECKTLSSLSTMVRSIKKVAITVALTDHHQLEMLSDLLRCFPCLESLDVLVQFDMYGSSSGLGAENSDYWEHKDCFECLDLHLKSVKLRDIFEGKTAVGFANFLIAKARMLEVMTIFTRIDISEGWIGKIMGQLSLQNRASPDATVVFKQSNA